MEILIMRCKAKVAILMATYNGEKYLKEQIESILKVGNFLYMMIVQKIRPQFTIQVQRW